MRKPIQAPQEPNKNSEWQALVQGMLRANAISEVIAFTRDLYTQNKMTIGFAKWIFNQAEKWHIKGWSREQWQLYELVEKYIPENWLVLHVLGYHAQVMGENKKAERYYERALERKPDYVFSQLALGHIRMLQTAFHEGRELYETRFAALDDRATLLRKQMLAPRWHSENLRDKSLYLWAEQGLGDIIMFAGFLPYLLAQSPKNITLGIYPRLISLFARSFPQITVEPIEKASDHTMSPIILEAFPLLLRQLGDTPLPSNMKQMQLDYEQALQYGKFDYASPMGDLLVECMPKFPPVEPWQPYLKASPEKIKHVKKNLAKLGSGRKIGISWHTTNIRDSFIRDISLKQLKPILSANNCHFISLQHNIPSESIKNFCDESGFEIHIEENFDPINDVETLAALISSMDEVITIDNSNVHLAGALGVPTTLLLPKGCNFRWPLLENSSNNLWYRSVKLIRQAVVGDWDGVIMQVAETLKNKY